MIVTDREARQKWCPYRLTLAEGNKCEGAGCMAFILDSSMTANVGEECGICGMVVQSHE